MRNALCVLMVALAAVPSPIQGQEEPLKIPLRLVRKELRGRPGGGRRFDLVPGRETALPFATAGGHLLVRSSVIKGKMRILADRNGDGRLDEADGGPIGDDEPFEIQAEVGGRQVPYTLQFLAIWPGEATLDSQMVMEGEAEGLRIRIADADVDGRFGESGEDVLEVEAAGPGAPTVLRLADYLGSVVLVGERLYELTTLEQGWVVRLAPWAGEPARVSVKPGPGIAVWGLRLATADRHLFFAVAPEGKTPVVPGAYAIEDCILVFQPRLLAAGDSWLSRFLGIRPTPQSSILVCHRRGGRIEIRPGDNNLAVGPPFRLEAEAFLWGRRGDRLAIEDVWLVGQAGESYRADLQGDAGSTLKAFVQAGQERLCLASLEFG